MSDARTLRMAFRPVTPTALEGYVRHLRLEREGRSAIEALAQSGLTADEVTRIASAVNSFCRPRLLKRRLSRATARSPERERKQQEKLAAPLDDSQLVTLYGQGTLEALLAREEELVTLREQS